LAKLEEKGLSPAAPADRLTLLRRAKFDLHGLPPTELEIDEFLADTAPGAFDRLVDRLLASPRYGERWGRHWLDVARYADVPDAWRYRDYVIDAFNQDLPFDQFVVEQIAGDFLSAERPDRVDRGVVATGFLALGSTFLGDRDKKKLFYDVVDEQIDTTSKAFMALTIACARCHDHKFDPIPTKDYYSLVSIFASTQVFADIEADNSVAYRRPLVPPDVYETFKHADNKVKGREAQIEALLELAVLDHKNRVLHPRLADYMMAARKVRVEKQPPEAVAELANLDLVALNNWVGYLKPGFRPFLQKWHKAEGINDMSVVRSLAEEYQLGLQKTADDWTETIQKWSDEVDVAVRAGTAPPAKPEFLAFKDRFFAEVSLAFGTYQEAYPTGPFALAQVEREKILPAEAKERLQALQKALEASRADRPPEPAMAAAVGEDTPVEQAVLIRGNYNNPGEIVPKRFPAVLAGSDPPVVRTVSGRRELAEWLVQPGHPLTSRVIVNRIWQWHFSEGLVRTPNNFGIVGEPPTNPELLDYLARQLVERGWSIKAMHKLIMLSSAYQMSSKTSAETLKADGDNRLWSRFARRRLSVEEMRDSLLALDNTLDLTLGGEVSIPGGRRGRANAEDFRRRTVYVPVNRTNIPGMLTLFDFGDASQSWAKRGETNTAPQALYFMNNPFVHNRADAFAQFLLKDGGTSDPARVERAYRIALGRNPRPEELEAALEFIQAYPAKKAVRDEVPRAAWLSFCKTLIASNEFHYVD
jgi:hypothetical protein